MTVQKNIAMVQEATSLVMDHCMCLKFEDDGSSFAVIYPEGDFAVNGVRVCYREKGKLWALETILEKMEEHWLESYP